MKATIILTLLLTGFWKSSAQYSSDALDTINLENCSKAEIRQMFLDFNPDSEVYQLARQSRRNNTWSIIFYSAGGLFVLGGVSALIEMNSEKKSEGFSEFIRNASLPLIAVVNFSIGGIAIISGISQSKKSKKRLNKAIKLYQNY